MIKNVKDIKVGQKVYYVMLRDGEYTPVQGKVKNICCGFFTDDILAFVIDFGFIVERYPVNTPILFDDLYEATLYATRLKKITSGWNGKIAKFELIKCFNTYGKNEFMKKLDAQIAEYQDEGYYTEVQFSLTDCEYCALVIAREQ